MDLWIDVLTNISQKISKPSFETWCADTTADCSDGVVFVKAKNTFQADWIDARYKQLISETLEEVSNKSMEIKIVVDNEQLEIEQEQIQQHPSNNRLEELLSIIEVHQKRIIELEERVNRLEKI